MKLGDEIDALAYDAAFWSQGLTNRDYPIEQLGELTLDLSKKFRVLAIAQLLSSGQSRLFQDNLHRSGCVRKLYLERIKAASLHDDHHAGAARYSGLVDSIAAQSWDIAARIATLSRSSLHAGHEYPDDFCFAQLLNLMVLSKVDAPRTADLLGQWEKALEGEPDARLAVCAALHAGDAAAFGDAFDDLIRSRNRDIAEAEADGAITETDTYAERQVYVEGLALLALAQRRNMAVERDYLFCPAIARTPRTTPFSPFP